MKKIYLTLGLAAGLLFSSCSDFLDRDPSTALPAGDAITSVFDLKNAVNGVSYILSQDRMTYSAEFAIYADLLSGDFRAPYDMGQSTPILLYNMTKHDALPDYAYYYFYKALANVNHVLANLDKVAYTEKEKATFDDLHGELLAWRGLLHFDLARMFCHIPTTVANVEEAGSGLVLSTEVFQTDYKGERATLKATYDQIIKDFTDALPLLSKDKNLGYLNYWAVLGLRARANLYYGKNAEALADAKAVIEESPYTLYTMAEYANVWSQEGTSESIFEMLITDTYNAQRNSCGYYTDASGYPECAFSESSALYQYLSTHPEDVRSSLIKDESSSKDYESGAGYYPAKYPGRNGAIYVNNPKIIRLSEVYLIAAEASFHTEGGAAAAGYINKLRTNRIKDYADVASVTLDNILFEYEVELFAENQIAFAYWRNKKGVTSAEGKEIAYNDYRTIMPIPQREIDLNSQLKQNAEY